MGLTRFPDAPTIASVPERQVPHIQKPSPQVTEGAIMEKADIPLLSATELSGLIKKRDVSPVEAIDAYLHRIELLDPKLNAFLTVCGDEARLAAQKAEQALARGDYWGPMHGIPVGVKDQVYTKGIRTTGGSTIFKDFVPDQDATVIANLRASGAIIIGKTNMTEFATTAFYHCFGRARNPWDMERHTGGSSSGSASATAGSLCATSLGEDTGGSIRFPAAWCGLVGLKPSWGRVSRYGLIAGVWSLDTVGPISRTVEDSAMTLQAIAGHDPKDQYTWDIPVPDYQNALGGGIKGVRVGLVKELFRPDFVDAETQQAVSKAVDVLRGLGASVEEVSIPLAIHVQAIQAGLRMEMSEGHREQIYNQLMEIGHENRVSYLVGSVLPAQVYFKSQKLRALLRQQTLAVLEKKDVLISPTVGVPAQKAEADTAMSISSGLREIFTHVFNLAGAPALTICCGFTPENLPIGLQIGGKPFDEETVLKVAFAYEKNTAWHTRKPPI